MLRRDRTLALVGASILLVAASGRAQIMLPTRQHDTLDFELKSLRDDVTLYMGDPQELLLMDVDPKLTTLPRATYSGQANAVLQIIDQEWSARKASGEAGGKAKDAPYGQTWEVRLSPSGPTNFSLQCDQGKNTFDFSDFQVQKIDLSTDGATLDVGFKRQNPIVMESCNIRAEDGSLRFHGVINAQAKQVALYVPGAECQIELTGKAFEGSSEITLQGPPKSLDLVVSRKVGLKISGPAATTAKFAADHMVQQGDVWASRDYDLAKCRIHLTFAEEIPKLTLKWN